MFLNHVLSFLGLQMTNVELDARVTALEENGGSGTFKCNFKSYFFFTV